MLRVNPLFQMVWWLVWLIPLWIGFRMYLKEGGLVWHRTPKIDANHDLILSKTDDEPAALNGNKKKNKERVHE